MSLGGITSSTLSALTANAAALNTISDNISNLNTTGYVRRTTSLSATTANGQVTGVEVSEVRRSVDRYLDQETLSALGTTSQYKTESTLYSQVDAQLGHVGDGNSLPSLMSDVTTALALASQSNDSSSKASVVDALDALAAKVTSLDASLNAQRNDVDAQVSATVASINNLLKQIGTYNQEISAESALGNSTSGLCDQRDQALQSLAELMDIKIADQGNGAVKVTTNDGTLLVGDSYAQLSYAGGLNGGGYDSIKLTYTNPRTGNQVGGTTVLDPHIQSGKLGALLTMRDGTIGELQLELGNLAKNIAEAYNEVGNDYTAAPPPHSLIGTQTGLLAGDTLTISGSSTVAVTDADGKLVAKADIAYASGDSVQDIVDSINTQLAGSATASFVDGKLTITATGATNGVVVQDDSGTGLSDFFGMNDIFECAIPTASATGLSSASLCGCSGEISLDLRDANGVVVRTATVTVSATDSFATVLSNLNTAFGGAASLSMNADGSVDVSMGTGFGDCTLLAAADGTERGATGVSLTGLFGIGDNTVAAYAGTLSLKASIDDTTIPFADTAIDSSTAVGDLVVGSGDTSGAVALQKVETASRSIDAAGNLSARTASISNYAGAFYQDIASRSAAAESSYTTESDRLVTAQALQSSAEGVNLDEELANMVIFQQAYNAAARMLTTLNDLYDTLLSI